MKTLPGGELDSVQSLYIDNTPSAFKGNRDPYNITVNGYKWQDSYSSDIRILVPEGFREVYSIDTKNFGRLCLKPSSGSCNQIFKANVRAMITKIPGFFFMSY